MNFEQLYKSSWIYSECSGNWYFPSSKPHFIHELINKMLSKHLYKHFHSVNGIEEISFFYNTLRVHMPEDCLPKGVFTHLFIVTSENDKTYYIFTDVQQLYR